MAEGDVVDAGATAGAADAGKVDAGAADAGKAAIVADAGAADAGKAAEGDKAKADAGADKPKDGDGKAAEPIDYAKALAEVKLPEGMTLDPAAAKLGTDLFAKHNIPAEAAKDLVALYAQQQKAGADGNAKAFATQVDGWKAEAEKSTTAEERGTAKDATLKVFPKELVTVFEAFGLTNRADFIKSMGNLGKAIKDDTFVPGNAGAVNGVSDARKQFPNSNMNP